MEIDLTFLALRRADIADDIQRCANMDPKPECIRLFKHIYEEVRKDVRAKPDEPLQYQGIPIIKGPPKKKRTSKKIQESLFE